MLNAKLVRRSSIAAFVLACSLGCSTAAELTEQAVDYQSVEFGGKLRDGRVTFKLHISCDETSAQNLPKVKFLGVTDRPTCIVRMFTFSLNGKDVSLPPKSYADLADVSIGRGVYVTTRGDLVVIHVHGGDGESAYKTRYLINSNELVARELEELDEGGEPSVTRQTYERSKPDNSHKKY